MSVRAERAPGSLKGNQVKVLSDPVTVNEEQSGDIPLRENVRRCSFVMIHKPGDLLKMG